MEASEITRQIHSKGITGVIEALGKAVARLQERVEALEQHPKKRGRALTEQELSMLHAEFDTELGEGTVNDELRMCQDHPSARNYPNTQLLYAKKWLKRTLGEKQRKTGWGVLARTGQEEHRMFQEEAERQRAWEEQELP